MTTPVFYTQSQLDDTNEVLEKWRQSSQPGDATTFPDATGAVFGAQRDSYAPYPVIVDGAGTPVGTFLGGALYNLTGTPLTVTTITRQAPQATTNSPVFYKQTTLDGTNSAILVAAQTPPPGTGTHVFTFYDDLCNQFTVNLTNARAYLGMVLEVTDANGVQVGWYHMKSARLTDSQDVFITCATYTGQVQQTTTTSAQLPTFYTQASLDSIIAALHTAHANFTATEYFFDDSGTRFKVDLSTSTYTITHDASGALVGYYDRNNSRLLSAGPGVPRIRVSAAPVGAGVTPPPAHPLSYSALGIKMGGHLDLTQVPAAAQAMRQRDCDHVWVDVGFFSGKQACKKCDLDKLD